MDIFDSCEYLKCLALCCHWYNTEIQECEQGNRYLVMADEHEKRA